jgi:hypothetical protein
MAISIPAEVFTKYQEAADAMIDDLGIPCKLIYPGKVETTTVDLSAQKTIKRLSVNNVAPVGFTHGTTDLKVTEPESNITLRLYWSQRDWAKAGFKYVGGIEVPDGSVMTIGYLADMDQVQRAQYLIANTNFSSYQEYKFQKAMEPQPWGMKQDRYFICIWTRV